MQRGCTICLIITHSHASIKKDKINTYCTTTNVHAHTYIHTHSRAHTHTRTHARTHAHTHTHTHTHALIQKNTCVLQVRLPTGTVIQVEVGWRNYMNSVIYLSVSDYAQTEGRDINRRRYRLIKYGSRGIRRNVCNIDRC